MTLMETILMDLPVRVPPSPVFFLCNERSETQMTRLTLIYTDQKNNTVCENLFHLCYQCAILGCSLDALGHYQKMKT